MEERDARQEIIDSRLRKIENEIKSLHSSIERQTHLTAETNAGLARVHSRLDSLGEELADFGKQDIPAVWVEFNRRFSEIYVFWARILLRANIDDLFDRGYYVPLNRGLNQSGLDPVYHYLTARTKISPHWMFDREYYLAKYQDVAAAKAEPLVHFLRAGWREGRNPHPLFDTRYYMEQAPEVKAGKLNPVAHYLHGGWQAGLQPHPLVDHQYYLASSPDVVAAGMDPLSHYILFGAKEGRKPHPWFDTDYYRARNADVLKDNKEPVQHYLETGADEGRDPHPLFETQFYREMYGHLLGGMNPLEHFVRYGEKQGFHTNRTDCRELFLPVRGYSAPPPRNRMVDIVVPVYRGYEETRACIESVLASRNREPFELVAINDRSPDDVLSGWLVAASAGGSFTLLQNETNVGFVATANRGMALHPDRDVVLLNSDTTVANDWLDRLVACAYRGRVGTVTPFSNNATICSYPRFCEDNMIPPDVSAGELDRLAAEANAGRSAELPTAVGFCMYIRRDCLRETGAFDVEAFRTGYGEENDFSLRAAAKGWRNLLAADVFVYHAGGVSFGPGAESLREHGMRALLARHPSYSSAVSRHIASDAAGPFRFAMTAARYRHSGRPTVLLISHDLGGGVGQHIEELIESQKGKIQFLLLQPAEGAMVKLSSGDAADGVSLRFDSARQYEILIDLLRSCNVSRLHIHHTMRHTLSLEKLRQDLGVPLVFTAHDHYSICPRVVLAGPDGRYCGEPDEAGCNACIRGTLPHLNLDIASWRAKHAWLIDSAELAIAPSNDVAARMKRYFPAARIEAASHPAQLAPEDLPAVAPPDLKPDETMRIAVLGVMSIHKGFDLMDRCARISIERGLPLEFVLIGYCEKQLRDREPPSFRQTGEYTRDQLDGIIAAERPAVVWFPVRLPETFSYTVSICLEQGLPVAAPRIGSMPERLSGRAWSWVYDWDAEPEALVAMFLRIRESMVMGASPRRAPVCPQAAPDFYVERYRQILARRIAAQPMDLRMPGKLAVIAVVSSFDSGQMQSCGYIRAYLPLKHTHAAMTTVTSPASALRMAADILLVQRTAIPNLEMAEATVRHCQNHGIRLVYETDDDLFHMDLTHSESSFYRSLIPAAEWIAKNAGMVVVSSEALKTKLAAVNSEIRAIPNALDEALWFGQEWEAQARPRSKTVRILYMGTMTHARDLDLLEQPMRQLKREFGGSVQLDVVGITPDRRKRDWFHFVPAPGNCGPSYPLFVEWLRKENRWDFAVAPLVDDAFNRCKSYIKYLDYGALGLPGIFSAIGVFEPVVRDGENGFLADGNADWHACMRRLVTDSKLRKKTGETAYRDVRENHTLAAQAARGTSLMDRLVEMMEAQPVLWRSH
jgi:GT2 family glycosyltransferase/glycosyltransferase involved in cell wall biosynthesis